MTRRIAMKLRLLVTAVAPIAALSVAGCNDSWERAPKANAPAIVVVDAGASPETPRQAYGVPPASVIRASPEEQPPSF